MCFNSIPDLTPRQTLILQGTEVFSNALTSFASARAARSEGQLSADLQNVQANDIARRGAVELNTRRQAGRQQVGQQRAVLASRNLDLNVGTPADIVKGTNLITAIDAATIRDETARNTQLARFGAGLTRASARSVSPLLEGTGTLLAKSKAVLRSAQAGKKAGI